MSNEVIFILSAVANILFILFAARRGVEWLLATIPVNLILIAIFGAKLITVFGFITNAGNVFYACVFLATHFLIERHGKRAGLKTIWYGACLVLFFVLMSNFATQSIGLPLSDRVNSAILTLFSFSLRITFASIIAYVFAQCVNILVYEWLKEKTHEKFLWLRSNGANVIAQLVDSLLFFSIAFFDLPGPLLVQAILAGWFIKILVVAIGTPFLYFDAYLERKKI
ncbi:MAG: queuosine precursor transporter [bacterium]|nr:queuosine precursor transporter [bacterium]